MTTDALAAPSLPRQVFCIIDEQYRSLERAEDVAEGCFTHAGVTLSLGLEPDWLASPYADDREWRIEWSKFYYGLDLAHAFELTGDDRFVQAWVRLVCSWMDQMPVDHDSSDITARRVQNWIYAWRRFADAPAFDGLGGGVEHRILDSIGAQLEHVRTNLTAERNHRTLELYALFIGSLAHPRLDADGSLLSFATHELYRNVCVDILPDGVHRELSTHYHAIVLRTLLGTRVNARRFGVQLPPDYDDRVITAFEFLAWVRRPDGTLPMLGDSDNGDYAGLLELAAAVFGRADLLFAARAGSEGTPPSERVRTFPDAGYHIMRSGWGDRARSYEDELHLVFDCGPMGPSGHGHYDALHIEASAGGKPLLVDPGRYTYSEAGERNWRHWFKGTSAHNTVTVDGLDQTPYRPGKPKGPTATARLLGARTGAGVTELLGEVVSPVYDAIHRRRVLFVHDSWWLVEDALSAVDEHRYELRFHLPPEALDSVDVVGASVLATPGMFLCFDGDVDDVTIEQGWVAPEYGVRQEAPVIVVTAQGRSSGFLTAVVPTSGPQSAQPPRLLRRGLHTADLEHVGTTRVDWSDERLVAQDRP